MTHYEVYLMELRGDWSLQQRYVSSERQEAIDEAKRLEAELNLPTKVVRELFNPQSGMAEEQVVYISPKARELRERAMRRAGPHAAGGGPDSWVSSRGEKAKAKGKAPATSLSDLMARMILVVTASLILAGIGGWLAPSLLSALSLTTGGGPASGNMRGVMVGVFLFLFTVSFLVIGRKLIPYAEILSRPKKTKPIEEAIGQRPDMAPGAHLAPPPKAATSEEALSSIDPVALMEDMGPIPVPPPPTEPEQKIPAAQSRKARKKAAEARAAEEEAERRRRENQDFQEHDAREMAAREKEKRAKEAEARKAAEKEAEDKAAAEKEAEEKAAEQAKAAETLAAEDIASEPPASSPEQDRLRLTALSFLGEMVAALKVSHPQLDVYDRFGINLFLAGACETLVAGNDLSGSAKPALLREMLGVMGTRPALALMFSDKLDEYLMEPRYMQMLQAGRQAMGMKLAGGGEPFAPLPQLMADWRAPQAARPATASTVAIVFTDMVGSTDINARFGDRHSHEITRVHNAIVRAALGRFDGREVKHTGDGIMATFPVVSQAVEAMIEVQKALAEHNRIAPDLRLDLRVGINAGEPLVDENDYHGLSVTLAARLCAQAQGGEVLCSGVVRDLAQGKDLTFRDRGQVMLKGIGEPQRLFEAVWRDADAPSPPPPPPPPAEEPAAFKETP
ncbi:adenylate/guanylate cyclase [Rhodospirillum rubrum F11]|nr:adenylate/guanylate cyclase [Rhodospirillum rubrum F11]